MKSEHNYLEINKQSWNNKVDFHLKSDFYDLEGFLKGNTSLNDIELNLLGDIPGKTVLHLQCHFGQDSISLARMGAKVSAVDLSDKAIEAAKKLATDTGTDVTFICSDIYDLPQHLDQHFDIVFTSYGTIGWLPDLDKWAQVVSTFLKPGGTFVFAEFHPVVWMFDDHFENVSYNYLNEGAIVETESGTYADREAGITQEYVMWNHGIGSVVNNLIKHNIAIQSLDEYDYSPYDCFQGTVKIAHRKYRIKHLDNKIPLVYALTGTKK